MPTFKSFAEFYPYYLSEHDNRMCRRLHFVGSLLVILFIALGVGFGELGYFLAAPVAGYGFAWVGHFFFEHNKPATFRYPLYSLRGDWKMFGQILSGKIAF